ncbi:acyl-CoA dehydratase activase-related protein [Candidatus Clostridium radicumherbarum]|uniref:Acyl-CoA dehydratase activase-related protein n=1 Tax=Candidatus Clostridium radicumherbarum TaxID=3381662 RepID=A0ABW8TRD6_9CLOT
MIVGIPQGLMNYKYYPYFEVFFKELGVNVLTSKNTNREIFNEGVKYCTDEACIPIKVFHGHTAYLKNKCDMIFVPRIMQLNKKEYICPKFCGLPEMIKNNINDLPPLITSTIYAYDKKHLLRAAKEAASAITRDKEKINKALTSALQIKNIVAEENKNIYKYKIGLIGHPYNIYDSFVNMNVVNKLKRLGASVITEDNIAKEFIEMEVKCLFKRPFWAFAKDSFGSSVYLARNKVVDGLIYISSFACGIDSIVLELIKNEIGNFPLLTIKLDEHTGEAGVDTRLEAFVDMLERREFNENYLSSSR